MIQFNMNAKPENIHRYFRSKISELDVEINNNEFYLRLFPSGSILETFKIKIEDVDFNIGVRNDTITEILTFDSDLIVDGLFVGQIIDTINHKLNNHWEGFYGITKSNWMYFTNVREINNEIIYPDTILVTQLYYNTVHLNMLRR